MPIISSITHLGALERAAAWGPAQRAVRRALGALVLLAAQMSAAPASAATAEEDVMFAASRVGNVALFRDMIKAGAKVDARDAGGNTALVYATLSDSDDMVREVLSHHPDPDRRGSLGMTALGIATAHGALHTVGRLLRAGANPDVADASGVTPLASALRLDRGAVAERLLAARADPGLADRDGVAPLHIAAEKGDAAMTIHLLVAGADPNVLDNDHRSPLFLALFNHHREVVEAMVRRPQTDLALVSQGYSPLFWARQMGYEDIAQSIAARLRKG